MNTETRPHFLATPLMVFLLLTMISQLNGDGLIDLSDRAGLKKRGPILIAHRGGVIAKDAPECSLTAISRAADRGYDMVELDVQSSRDAIPVVFHDKTLDKACGRSGRIRDYSGSEIITFKFLNSEDRILTLDTALMICRENRLGVMLDFKSGYESEVFLKHIDQLILKHQLHHSTITITGSKKVRSILKFVMCTPSSLEMQTLRKGIPIQLNKRFWFGLPHQLLSGDVEKLKKANALIFPAINIFRYPANRHKELASRDIRFLLSEGVHGFQIDSIYDSNFSKVTR